MDMSFTTWKLIIGNDLESSTAIFLIYIIYEFDEGNLNDVEPKLKSHILHPVPELEDWRIGLLFDAIDILEDSHFIEDFDKTLTKDIINLVCIS